MDIDIQFNTREAVTWERTPADSAWQRLPTLMTGGEKRWSAPGKRNDDDVDQPKECKAVKPPVDHGLCPWKELAHQPDVWARVIAPIPPCNAKLPVGFVPVSFLHRQPVGVSNRALSLPNH